MTTVTAEMLELHEAVAGTAGPVRSDGLVPLHIIRPGIGKGRGRHLYEADMLQREVADGRFNNWKMYVDHQAPEAKKASAGLPRSIRDLAGVIKEAWWDPNVPADARAGHGQGAVVGLAKVNRFMRTLIEDIPEAIGASISAQATGVRPKMVGGQQVWLVEGIQPRGSVDFVTEAGAGGKVVSLLEHALQESWFEDEEEARTMLEGLAVEQVLELLEAERPDVVSALLEAKGVPKKKDVDFPGGDGGKNGVEDDDEDDDDAISGGRAKRVKSALKENKEGVAVTDIKELLTEALKTDEGKAIIEEAVTEQFKVIVAPKLAELIEAALEDERELVQAEAGASTTRTLEVRDMRDEAHKAIRESKLPASMQTELTAKYDIVGAKPTASLDVQEAEVDGETKSALDVLLESVNTDIEAKRAQVAEIRPTQVRGQGPTKKAPTELAEGEKAEEKTPGTSGSGKTDHLLIEAGVASEELTDLWSDL